MKTLTTKITKEQMIEVFLYEFKKNCANKNITADDFTIFTIYEDKEIPINEIHLTLNLKED